MEKQIEKNKKQFWSTIFKKSKNKQHINSGMDNDSQQKNETTICDVQGVSGVTKTDSTEQIQQLLEYVKNSKQYLRHVFDTPGALQTQLEKEANELNQLVREYRAAVQDTKRIQRQRKAVICEINKFKEYVVRKKEEGIREKELFLKANNRFLFTRWENTKNTKDCKELINFLQETQKKQRTNEVLQELIQQKLDEKFINENFSLPDNVTSQKSIKLRSIKVQIQTDEQEEPKTDDKCKTSESDEVKDDSGSDEDSRKKKKSKRCKPQGIKLVLRDITNIKNN